MCRRYAIDESMAAGRRRAVAISRTALCVAGTIPGPWRVAPGRRQPRRGSAIVIAQVAGLREHLRFSTPSSVRQADRGDAGANRRWSCSTASKAGRPAIEGAASLAPVSYTPRSRSMPTASNFDCLFTSQNGVDTSSAGHEGPARPLPQSPLICAIGRLPPKLGATAPRRRFRASTARSGGEAMRAHASCAREGLFPGRRSRARCWPRSRKAGAGPTCSLPDAASEPQAKASRLYKRLLAACRGHVHQRIVGPALRQGAGRGTGAGPAGRHGGRVDWPGDGRSGATARHHLDDRAFRVHRPGPGPGAGRALPEKLSWTCPDGRGGCAARRRCVPCREKRLGRQLVPLFVCEGTGSAARGVEPGASSSR